MTNDKSEVDVVVAEVKQGLRGLFGKSGELIKKLGNGLKKIVKEEESICEEIKIALKEEIAEGVISTRTIELHCLPKWKRKTKPKQRENEKTSFSKQVEQPQQQTAQTKDGKSVIINKTSRNTNESSDNFKSEGNGKIMQFQKELGEHITSPSTRNEATRYVTHIPMSFEALQKDMTAVFRTSNGKVANVYFKVSVDLNHL